MQVIVYVCIRSFEKRKPMRFQRTTDPHLKSIYNMKKGACCFMPEATVCHHLSTPQTPQTHDARSTESRRSAHLSHPPIPSENSKLGIYILQKRRNLHTPPRHTQVHMNKTKTRRDSTSHHHTPNLLLSLLLAAARSAGSISCSHPTRPAPTAAKSSRPHPWSRDIDRLIRILLLLRMISKGH